MLKRFLFGAAIATATVLSVIGMKNVESTYADELEMETVGNVEEETVGNVTEEGTSGIWCDEWFSNFSQAYEIDEEGIEITFNSKTYEEINASAGLVWDTPLYIIHYSDDNYLNYGEGDFCFISRSDGFGWTSIYDGAEEFDGFMWINTNDGEMFTNAGYNYETTGVPATSEEWTNWMEANKNGVKCTLKAVKDGDKLIVEFTNNGLTSKATIPVDADKDVCVTLSGEKCTLSDINGKDEEYSAKMGWGNECSNFILYKEGAYKASHYIGYAMGLERQEGFAEEDYDFSVVVDGVFVDGKSHDFASSENTGENTIKYIFIGSDCFGTSYLLLERVNGKHEIVTETGEIVSFESNNIVLQLAENVFLVEDNGGYSVADKQGNILSKNVFSNEDLVGQTISLTYNGNVSEKNGYMRTYGTVENGYKMIFFSSDWQVINIMTIPDTTRVYCGKGYVIMYSSVYTSEGKDTAEVMVDLSSGSKEISLRELPEIPEKVKSNKDFKLSDIYGGVKDGIISMEFTYVPENEIVHVMYDISTDSLSKLLAGEKETIIDKIEAADKGESVEIKTEKNEAIKSDTLEAARQKGITLVIETANGMKWTIKSEDIKSGSLKDIDLTVEKVENVIPKEAVDGIHFDGDKIELSLAHSGEFGFKASLTINVDAKNKGKFANLFYYNPVTKKLEFMQSSKVVDNGDVMLDYTHASDYIIVLSNEEYKEAGSSEETTASDKKDTENKDVNSNTDTTAPQTGDSTGIIVFALFISFAAAMIFVINRKVYNKIG